MKHVVVAFLLFTFPLSSLYAAQNQVAPGRVVITTRLVAIFSELESNVLTALQKKDGAALDKLLSDEFQVWTADPPGSPLPREDWQAQAFGSPPASFHLRQMAVRPVSDDVAIASFVLQESSIRDGKEISQQRFIVDVWKKNGDGWLCTDRYASNAAESPSQQSDKKPTGKQ